MQYNRAVKKKDIAKLPHKLRDKVLSQLKEVYRDATILMQYQEGISITQIAKENGLNKSTVSRIIKNYKELL